MQEEIYSLDNPVSIKDIEFNFPTQRTSGPFGFTSEFYQTFKKEII